MTAPYVTSRYVVYWEFPSSTERLAATVEEVEVGRIAWQKSDDTFYFLLDTTPTWSSIGGGAGAVENPHILQLEAGENLTAGTPVYISANKFYIADNVTNTRCIGIIASNVLATFTATAVFEGKMTLSGLTPQATYYLGNGVIQDFSPATGLSLPLGEAVSSTVLIVNIQRSILLV